MDNERPDMFTKLLQEKIERLELDCKDWKKKYDEMCAKHTTTKSELAAEKESHEQTVKDLKLLRDQHSSGSEKQLFQVRKQNMKLWEKMESVQMTEKVANRRAAELRVEMDSAIQAKADADKIATKKVSEKFDWERKLMQRRIFELEKKYQNVIDSCDCAAKNFKYRGLWDIA